MLADERQRTVDLRKPLRLKKGVFWNEIAADGEIPLGGVVVILKIMSVMDALSVIVPFPSHKLDTALGGVARQHRLQSILRTRDVDTLLPVQHAALSGDAAETPFFPADGQVVILDGLYRETVLPQPGGGFFKVTELRGDPRWALP